MAIVKNNHSRILEVMLSDGSTISIPAYGKQSIPEQLIESPHLLSFQKKGKCAIETEPAERVVGTKTEKPASEPKPTSAEPELLLPQRPSRRLR